MKLPWLKRNRWKNSKCVSEPELKVLRALLPRDDPRTKKLLAQVVQAPHIERNILAIGKYRLSIPCVLDSSLLIDLDNDMVSPSIEVSCEPNQRKMRFTAELLRGGFLHSLLIETADGKELDTDWDVEQELLDREATRIIQNWFPVLMSKEYREQILARLEKWLDIDSGTIAKYNTDQLNVFMPCQDEEFCEIENSEGGILPQEYKNFLQISNGIDLLVGRPYIICGTRDLHIIQFGESNFNWWVVTDLYESGAVLMASNSDDAFVYLANNSNGQLEPISSLRQYIIDSFDLFK